MSTTTVTIAKSDDEAFFDSLDGKNVALLWTVISKMASPYPNPKATPEIWRYSEMKPALMESGKVVSARGAERRGLMLVNPTMGTYTPHVTPFTHNSYKGARPTLSERRKRSVAATQ
jgi:gentisate 1,2-dioxygenase